MFKMIFRLPVYLLPMILAAHSMTMAMPGEADDPQEGLDLNFYVKARSLIQRKYVDPRKLNEDTLMFDTLKGMVWSMDPLGDCWTPEAYQAFQALQKEAEVGIRWTMRSHQPMVLNVLPKSPADRAKVQVGDALIKISQKEMPQGLTLGDLEAMSRGPVETTLVLEFFHSRTELTTPVTLIRERVGDGAGIENIGEVTYVKAGGGTSMTVDDVDRKFRAMRGPSVKGVILDLRNTSDLSIEAASAVAGWLMPPQETVLAYASSAHSTLTPLSIVRRGEEPPLTIPVAVLVNRTTIGAAEVLASCLGDAQRGVVIGRTTAGFAPIFSLTRLKSGMVCRLASGQYLRRDRQPIHEKGVSPIIEVENAGADTENAAETDPAKDPYLKKAKVLLTAVGKTQ